LVYLNAAALTQVKTKKSIKKIVGKIKKLIHETYSGMKFLMVEGGDDMHSSYLLLRYEVRTTKEIFRSCSYILFSPVVFYFLFLKT
jgi:hypothetical protein